MPEDSSSGPESSKQKVKDATNQAARAMELPFTLIGPIVVGGIFGYFLDRWLHTSPWLMLVMGGLGVYAGLKEILRSDSATTKNGSKPSSS